MPPKAKTADDPSPSVGSTASGKLLIIGILILAVAAAASSWWFRYSATHRTVDFWSPKAALLIRDAPRIDFVRIEPGGRSLPVTARILLDSGNMVKALDQRTVSNAPGMTHLRNALLQDHSFEWPARVPEKEPHWQWALLFRNDSPGGNQAETEWATRFKELVNKNPDVNIIVILFTDDCTQATIVEWAEGKVISCQPIAPGLRQMFAEFASDPTSAK